MMLLKKRIIILLLFLTSCTSIEKTKLQGISEQDLDEHEQLIKNLQAAIIEKVQYILTPVYGKDNYNTVVSVSAGIDKWECDKHEIIPIFGKIDPPVDQTNNIYSIITRERIIKETWTGDQYTINMMFGPFTNRPAVFSNTNRKYHVYERERKEITRKTPSLNLKKKYEELDVMQLNISITIDSKADKNKKRIETEKNQIESLITGIINGYIISLTRTNQNNVDIRYINGLE